MTFIEHSGKRIVPLWINGQAPAPEPSRLLEVTNAREARIVHHTQEADANDARAAVDAAAVAFKTWKLSRHSDRRDIILRAADLFVERQEQLAEAQVLETSWPRELAYSLADVRCIELGPCCEHG